jgi:hypothetical protein
MFLDALIEGVREAGRRGLDSERGEECGAESLESAGLVLGEGEVGGGGVGSDLVDHVLCGVRSEFLAVGQGGGSQGQNEDCPKTDRGSVHWYLL